MKVRYQLLAFLVMLSFCFTSTAYAATDDGTFTRSSGRQFYTPINCTVTISSSTIRLSNLHWEDRAFGALLYWEGEIRSASTEYTAKDVYSDIIAVTGTLPYLYYEDDKSDVDDVTLGCNDMSGLRADSTYYVTATVTTGPRYDGASLIFESEHGIWMAIDGLPTRYQAFGTQLNTSTRKTISW